MLIVLLPLVVVGVLVAVASGLVGRDVVRWAGVGVGLLLVGLVVLAGIAGLGLGRDARSSPEEDDGASVAATTTAAQTSNTTATAGPPSSAPGGTRRPASLRPVDAVLAPREDDAPFPTPALPLDGLADGDALFVEAALERDGELRQCPADAATRTDCGAGLAVPAPARGVARFLAVVEEILATAAGPIDCASQPCSLVLFAAGENRVLADLGLVFGAARPTPHVEVAGRGPFADGDETDVVLTGFAPGELVVVTQCTPPGPSDHTRCGAPAAEVAVRIGADGNAVARYPVHLGAVGADGHECRRGESCAIAVTGADVPTAPVEISLAGSPGPDVAGGRAAWALVVAVLLAVVASVLVVRTDWRPPDGDPFGDLVLSVPPGWERLHDVDGDVARGSPP